MKKIAFIVYTAGLEFDDRVRKEALCLSKHAHVTIFVLLANNERSEGVTSYGIPYKAFELKSRKVLPSAHFLLVKAFEFFCLVHKHLKEYDIVWTHDVEPFLFPLLLRRPQLIWDLHEIPQRFLKNSITRKLFQFIETKCLRIIHANKNRIDYLIENKLLSCPKKHLVIRNFPDTKFEQSTLKDEKYDEFQQWRKGDDYVYLQGLQGKGRYPYETIEALMRVGKYKAVVVGRFDAQAKQQLLNQYGEKLEQQIYFRGMVNQLAIPAYLKDSSFSIILYATTTPNNRYCEPNRMFQSIIFEKPVIVGCNEPMSELVNKYSLGVSLNRDGRNIEEITEAIQRIIQNYDMYLNNIRQHKNNITWASQEDRLASVLP